MPPAPADRLQPVPVSRFQISVPQTDGRLDPQLQARHEIERVYPGPRGVEHVGDLDGAPILTAGEEQARVLQALGAERLDLVRIRRGEDDEGEYASRVVLPFLSSRVDLDALHSSDATRVARVSRQILEMLPDPEFGSLLWGKRAASLQVELWSGELMNAIREVQAALAGA